MVLQTSKNKNKKQKEKMRKDEFFFVNRFTV